MRSTQKMTDAACVARKKLKENVGFESQIGYTVSRALRARACVLRTRALRALGATHPSERYALIRPFLDNYSRLALLWVHVRRAWIFIREDV